MTELHALCCDCSDCLNGSGGYVIPGAGATKPTPGDKAPRRGLPLNERLAYALEQQEQAEKRLSHYRGVVRELSQGGAK